MRINRSLFFILLCFSIVSCKKKQYSDSDIVEQRLIFQHYTCTYDNETGTFFATAAFSLNNLSGNSLMLTKKSSVSLNDVVLEPQITALGSCVYSLEEQVAFPEFSVFQYVNNEDALFETEIKLVSFELKEPPPSRISKTTGINMLFNGDAFEEDEILSSLFYQNQELMFTIPVELNENKSLSLSPEELKDIPVGNYDIQWIRSYESSDVNSMDRGGWIERTYRSKMYNITIVK